MTPRSRWHPWAMLAPSLALLVVFFVVPIGIAAYESLFSWDLLTPPRFVGAANYRALAAHGELLRVALRTLGYSAMVVAGTMSLGLAMALLVNRPGRFFALVRASIFSAYVVSWVAVALLWMGLFDRSGGSLLGDPRWALPALAFVAVWKLAGYAMILFLAGLQAVPPSLLEAAALDGAGAWGRFRHVTFPLLMPTAAFVATTTLVTSFQAFDVVRIMTQGGPGRTTELFVYAIYEQVFLDLSVGRASALTVVFFAMLLALSTLQLRAWRGRGPPRDDRPSRPAALEPARATLPYVVGLVAAAAWVVPYAWIVATAFKTLPEIVARPTALLPEHLDLGAYREVFAAMPVARYTAVTIGMAMAIATAQVVLALPAGYALAKLRFAGSPASRSGPCSRASSCRRRPRSSRCFSCSQRCAWSTR